MVIFSDTIGSSTSVSTSFAEIDGSPYSPKVNGRLVQIRVHLSNTNASSLTEGYIVKFESVSFGGIEVHCAGQGNGLHTAPAMASPTAIINCDVPVKVGVTIKVSLINTVTPTTPVFRIIGVFQA
jgi:hypothetical protein